MDMLMYLAIISALFAVFALGMARGDTDGEPEILNPDQIKGAMRGLRPDTRLYTAFMLLGHAWTNVFVEGLVVAGIPGKRARPAGRFLAAISVATLLYGFWLLTQTPN